MTQVDFYGLSFSLTATDNNAGATRSIGFETTRSDILSEFLNIPNLDDDVVVGNPDFMKELIFKNSSSILTRILAPKMAGPTDLESSSVYCNQTSHFLDDYITKQCFKANRSFTCYSKLYPDTKTMYYGLVDSVGETLSFFLDASHTQPYKSNVDDLPLKLARPASAKSPPQPDFQSGFSDWHNVSADPMSIGATSSSATPRARGAPEGGKATEFPTFYYSKILHDSAIGGKAYALSYDDVFGTDPTVYVQGSDKAQETVQVQFSMARST